MIVSATPTRPLPGIPEQWSTRVAFFIAGFGMATWAPLVPYAKARAALDEGTLGILLLGLGMGSILAMPIAGALAGRYGCRIVIIVASLAICVSLPFLAIGTSFAVLMPALLLFGAGVGTVDCVVNIQSVIVERASGKRMMSGFHGLFSVGGFVGAGCVLGILALGGSPIMAVCLAVAVILVAIAAVGRHLLPYANEASGSAFAIPRGIVLFIGLLCFVLFLTEGSALDWSAVFLSQIRGVDPAYAGLGYTAFATTMTIGRLTGDSIVHRVGSAKIMLFGPLCAALGLLIVILVPSWEIGLIGYALVGAGCSNTVPVLYSAIGRQTVMPEHIAVSAISTIGYAGILAGPAAIGFVAHWTSLPIAFGIVALLLVAVSVSSRALPR